MGSHVVPEGSVPRAHVVSVLTACGVSVSYDQGSGKMIMYSGDGIPEVQVLPAYVTRKMLHRLASKFDIQVAWFYHPEMCARGSSTAN